MNLPASLSRKRNSAQLVTGLPVWLFYCLHGLLFLHHQHQRNQRDWYARCQRFWLPTLLRFIEGLPEVGNYRHRYCEPELVTRLMHQWLQDYACTYQRAR